MVISYVIPQRSWLILTFSGRIGCGISNMPINIFMLGLYYKNRNIKDLPFERWIDIIGFEGYYQVSSYSRVRSLDRDIEWRNSIRFCKSKICRQWVTNRGCLMVNLSKNGVIKSLQVSRLVGIHFLPNPLNLPEINHITGDRKRNLPWEIEWLTGLDNIRHAIENGLARKAVGEDCGATILTNKQAISISKSKKSYSEISKKYGVSIVVVGRIKRGEQWGKITGVKKARRILTKEQIITIRYSTKSIKELMKLYNRAESTIWEIKNGDKYKKHFNNEIC